MKLLSVGPAESVPVLSQPVREFDGQHLGDVWRTLRRNLEGSPQAFVTLVGALPPPLEVEIATAGESQVVAIECLEDVRTLLGADSFAIRASYAGQDPMVRTPALVEQAATIIRAGSHVGFLPIPHNSDCAHLGRPVPGVSTANPTIPSQTAWLRHFWLEWLLVALR